MPVTVDMTLVESQNDLVRQLADLLATHPAGQHFRLMFAPGDLALEPDEVLVQNIDPARRVIELTPQRIQDLTIDSVVHDTQIVDPADEDFNRYAANPVAAKCLKRRNLHGQTVHIYD
ncbi:hypothetical protein [Nocardia farcinica]|uniref:hypothetical protein n=1 Tax=Nocardia farcinica TaxID=37329 RepID=UPI002457C8DD|nr:hypothetical protein [Nocardia farcinica]